MSGLKTYDDFQNRMQKIADLSYAGQVLGWDQQVLMPRGGAWGRGRQVATLDSIAHELFVEKNFCDLLTHLKSDSSLTEDQRDNVRLTLRNQARKVKLPQAFVETHSRVCSEAFFKWSEAKTQKKFSIFEPVLDQIVELKLQEAQYLGECSQHPYDTLLDQYEPGLTVKRVDEVFSQVQSELFPFMRTTIEKCKVWRDDEKILMKHYPRDQQTEVTKKLLKQMQFVLEESRMDPAPHPFCTTFGPGDVRITVRSDENFLSMMIFAALHEAGHAHYEQGVTTEKNYGLPLGEAISMAFHESQSRFWENNIGRSRDYWECNLPLLKQVFPQQMGDVSVDSFFKAANRVYPSLIRVEADELTYHAHIYIRYQVERAFLDRTIRAKDLPAFWNEQYEKILGIRPSHDGEGCLQDVHWAYGSFGYFPTYSFGSFYAAQLMAQMEKDIPDARGKIRQGDLAPFLAWLRKNVHAHGRRYTSDELLTRLTGQPLNVGVFVDYAKKKWA